MNTTTKQYVLTASAFAVAIAGYYILRDKYSKKQTSSSQSIASENSSIEDAPPAFTVEKDITGAEEKLLRAYISYTSNDDGTFTRQKVEKYLCTEVPCKMSKTETKDISEEEYLNAWKDK
jgi:hypothetical protein